MTYLSAKAWKNNAELIAEVAALFLDRDAWAIDLTYNTGKWWRKWRPTNFVTNDLDPRYGDLSEDFRSTPFRDDWFGLVAFDPPYVSTGGRDTSTIDGMNDGYGMTTSEKDPAKNQANLINPGITEAVRICAPGGIILVKSMSYISGGKLWLGDHHTLTHALTLPVRVEAIYHHIKDKAGTQPKKNLDGSARRQAHPRNNSSTLLALRKINPPTKEKK